MITCDDTGDDRLGRRDRCRAAGGGRADRLGRRGAADAPAADDRVDAGGRACCPVSSTRTPTWCSPATGPPSSPPAWPARPTPAAASRPPSPPPGPRRRRAARLPGASVSPRCAGRAPRRWRSRAGTASPSPTRRARCGSRAVHRRDHVPGAHVVPPEYAGRRATTSTLVTGPMLDGVRPVRALGRRVLRAGVAFDGDEARTVLQAGRAAGLGLRVHGNQLGAGPGVQLAVELGAASRRPLHAPGRRRRRRAGRRADTTWPPCCRAWSSAPGRPTPTRRRCSAPGSRSRWPPTATRAPATRPRCRSDRARGARDGVDPGQAVYAATAGGAGAAPRPTSAGRGRRPGRPGRAGRSVVSAPVLSAGGPLGPGAGAGIEPVGGSGAAHISVWTPSSSRDPPYRVRATGRGPKRGLAAVHAHLWTGGADSWVWAVPMDGSAPGLGLQLTDGELWAYSVESRDDFTGSNVRGHLYLHATDRHRSPHTFGGQPELVLPPGGRHRLAWTLAGIPRWPASTPPGPPGAKCRRSRLRSVRRSTSSWRPGSPATPNCPCRPSSRTELSQFEPRRPAVPHRLPFPPAAARSG